MASSVNWNKNALTRAMHDLLLPSWGEELYGLSRPRVLEEPKLFVGCLGLALSLGMLVVQGVIGRIRRLTGLCNRTAGIRPSQKPFAWKAVGT